MRGVGERTHAAAVSWVIGAVFVVAGPALAPAVRETAAHVALERARHAAPPPSGEETA